MNKYQEALHKLVKHIDFPNSPQRAFDPKKDEPRKYYIALQELVDQTKIPALEEVKKEWENDGWKWKEGKIYIELIKNNEDYTIEISIDKIDKTYCCFEDDDCDQASLRLTLQEHIRLTKTFRALGWFE